MRLVPSGTSIALPLTVSLGMDIAPNQVLELRAEFLDVADVGADRAVVEGADGRPCPALGHVEDGVEIFLAPLALDDAPGHLVDPAGRLPARRALAAAFVRVEACDDHERLGDGHRLVHHDDAGRADHGALALGSVDVHGNVDLVGGQDGRRGAARHHALELAPASNAAAVLVDQLPERDRHRRLDHPRLLDVAGHGVEPRAALALGPEPREPFRTAVDDVRHRHDGLDIVDDGGMPERALDGGEGRLDLGPSLLPLEGGQEPGLLTADVGPGPAMEHDIEIGAGALDVLAEESRRVGLPDRAIEDPPRLDVLAAEIDEAQV